MHERVKEFWSNYSTVKMIDINKNILLNLSEYNCYFDEFVNIYSRIYHNSMSGHKRIHRFTVSNPLFTYHNNFEQNAVKL